MNPLAPVDWSTVMAGNVHEHSNYTEGKAGMLFYNPVSRIQQKFVYLVRIKIHTVSKRQGENSVWQKVWQN